VVEGGGAEIYVSNPMIIKLILRFKNKFSIDPLIGHLP